LFKFCGFGGAFLTDCLLPLPPKSVRKGKKLKCKKRERKKEKKKERKRKKKKERRRRRRKKRVDQKKVKKQPKWTLNYLFNLCFFSYSNYFLFFILK